MHAGVKPACPLGFKAVLRLERYGGLGYAGRKKGISVDFGAGGTRQKNLKLGLPHHVGMTTEEHPPGSKVGPIGQRHLQDIALAHVCGNDPCRNAGHIVKIGISLGQCMQLDGAIEPGRRRTAVIQPYRPLMPLRKRVAHDAIEWGEPRTRAQQQQGLLWLPRHIKALPGGVGNLHGIPRAQFLVDPTADKTTRNVPYMNFQHVLLQLRHTRQ